MDYLFVTFSPSNQVAPLSPDLTAAEQAAGYGVTDPSLYAEFDSTLFDPDCFYFTSGFVLNAGIVTYDLEAARPDAYAFIKDQTAASQEALLDGYTPEQIAAQAAIAAVSRSARLQLVIDDLNASTTQEEARIDAASTALTVSDLKAIVFP